MTLPEYKRFPKEEYVSRWQRAKKLMAQKGIDALFISEGTNFTYFSGGTKDFSFTRPTFFILPIDRDPAAIVQWFTRDRHKREMWIDDIRLYKSLTGAPVDLIIETLKELGLSNSVIGAEIGFEQRLGITLDDFNKIAKRLPAAKFVDASEVLWALRMIKSQAEIECLRTAGQITAKAYEKLFSRIGEGIKEREVLSLLEDFHKEGGGARPFGFMNSNPDNYVMNCGSGGKPSEYSLTKGNVLWIDAGCFYREYASDYSRMASIGAPSADQKKMHSLVCEITQKCIDCVKPGIEVSLIDAINSAEWRKAGKDYDQINFGGGRIGHGVGMMVAEPPHVATYDHTVLEPGMVITIEPGIVTDYGCFHVEQNILVTNKGSEILSVAPTELRIIQD